MPKQKEFSGLTLFQSVLARLVGDTGTQIFNPFLTIIAAGLKTNVVVLGWLVGARSIMGLLAPAFGAFADRHGYRLTMKCGLLAASIGALLVGLSFNLVIAIFGMIIWGIGLAAFIPTLQAYLSSQLPYERRARGIGIVEYAWALAGIVGLFSMGFLIEQAGWRAPFIVLSVGMAVMAMVVGRFPQATHRKATNVAPEMNPLANMSKPARIAEFFRLGSNAKSAYANMFASSCFFFAAMQFIIAHGAWLAKEYEIGAAQLGTVALCLGCADLCGSVLVSLITDRIGKRTSVLLGCICAIVAYVLMPKFNVTLVWAVVGLAISRVGFEFSIVANIALLSEQVPEKRGKVLTLGSAGTLLGMSLAGITGPWLFLTYGVVGLSIVSASSTLLAIIVILVFVRE